MDNNPSPTPRWTIIHPQRLGEQQPTHTAVDNNLSLTTWWTTTLPHPDGQKFTHILFNNNQATNPLLGGSVVRCLWDGRRLRKG